MWLLADLFHDLPEVGDLDKPKLVFFFDEAHLLFDDAQQGVPRRDRADRAADPVQGRRRLLRHPDAQGRARRRARPARQPGAARAARVHPRRRQGAQGDGVDLPATPATTSRSCSPSSAPARPSSPCCPSAGAPTPVAWTRMRAPQSLMAPSPGGGGEPRSSRPRRSTPKYAKAVDRESAYERLQARLRAPAPAAGRRPGTRRPGPGAARRAGPRSRSRRVEQVLGSSGVRSMLRSAGTVLGREITRSLFGTARRRR